MRLKLLFAVFIVIAAGLLAAFAWRERFDSKPTARVLSVPSGDQEIAWFNTTTSAASWERFVAGVNRAKRKTPEIEVDDSRAFLEHTTSIPEVVLSWQNRPGKLRIRWYKQTGEIGNKQWIEALAERDPPPLAIIGGGSSDRARDLARDLNERNEWNGSRPLLLITTATANEVTLDSDPTSIKLTEVYAGRTFRFCFTNEQMARAVVDFIWHMPDLKPRGGPPNGKGEEPPPTVFPIQWEDDPYSIDLSEKFRHAVKAKTGDRYSQPYISVPRYSVGSFDRVNRTEEEFAQYILSDLPLLPEQRSLLVLPTSTAPARRFLRALTGESPLIGKYMVAVNGDAISINDVYRDGGLLWNIRDVPVPLVFFAHQNPIDWDDNLPPPAGTDEVLLFADLVRVLAVAAYPNDEGLVRNADELRDNLRMQSLIHFDADGNRKDGSEFVVCLRPNITEAGHINAQASLEVWNRLQGGAWKQVKPSHPLLAPFLSRPMRRLTGNGP